MSEKFDPVLVEVLHNELGAISEEAAIVILRTGQSSMVKTGDFATAICDARGRIIGGGFAAPFQLAAFETLMKYVLEKWEGNLEPGDVIVTNDPYAGMTHKPDVGVVCPVFQDDRVSAFVVAYSHHTDIGGRFPGGMSSKPTSLYEEGLTLPLLKYFSEGERNSTFVDVVRANVRLPDEWFGDLDAKVAGCRRGASEMEALVAKFGHDDFQAAAQHMIDYAERGMRAALSDVTDGEWTEEDAISDGDITISLKLRLIVSGNRIIVDFDGSSDQVDAALNMPFTKVKAAVSGGLKAMLAPDVAANSGFFAPVEVRAPSGSVLNPIPPAAVGGRAPVFFRIFDMLYRAMGRALPDRAAVPGVGGDIVHYMSAPPEGGESSAMLDLAFGGWGARAHSDGIDGVAPVYLGSYGSIPAEVIENRHPVVVEGFGYVPNTAGAGKYRGAMSVYRSWRFLEPGEVMVRTVRPGEGTGLSGGLAGSAPVTTLVSGGKDTPVPLDTHVHLSVRAGDVLYHETGGAGGFGAPEDRAPESVLRDVLEGRISTDVARMVYRVAISAGDLDVDETRSLRSVN